MWTAITLLSLATIFNLALMKRILDEQLSSLKLQKLLADTVLQHSKILALLSLFSELPTHNEKQESVFKEVH